MVNKLLVSEDGSHTVVSHMFDVTYHSIHGAVNESMTVFINAGLKYPPLESISHLKIFEMGFGTGLNPILSLIEADKTKRNVSYTGIEAYPISKEIINDLNYCSLLGLENEDLLNNMHGHDTSNNISDLELSRYFTFNKIIGKLEDTTILEQFHIIYFDAFAPSSQPELWEPDIFQKLYDATCDGGILVTYCAKGSFKRALKSVGYTIETLPGPTGKREMTRAIKK